MRGTNMRVQLVSASMHQLQSYRNSWKGTMQTKNRKNMKQYSGEKLHERYRGRHRLLRNESICRKMCGLVRVTTFFHGLSSQFRWNGWVRDWTKTDWALIGKGSGKGSHFNFRSSNRYNMYIFHGYQSYISHPYQVWSAHRTRTENSFHSN